MLHVELLEACKWKDEQVLAMHHVITGGSDVTLALSAAAHTASYAEALLPP